ncbi:MAG TPA: thiol:disulfide interchange protein DsbA/DsbL [Stenotrophomonas sp.]|jgi:thiol:disulfide interchange protein DsbA
MSLMSRVLFAALALAAGTATAAPAAADLVPGVDYTEIEGGQPYAPLAGKIEVVEVFGYTCPHCAHFEPQLAQWAARLPKNVRFTPVPAAFGGNWDAYARAYFAADQLGVAKRSHQAMFQAIHDKQTLPTQNVSPQELAMFYAGYGIEPQRYIDTLKSEAVNARFQAARTFVQREQVPGTPALIVNGVYLVRGRDFDQLLRNADALIARVQAGAGAAR